MKNEKLNPGQVWKQFEDFAIRMRLSLTDRAVYSHLLRHSRLEGSVRFRFTLRWLAQGAGLSVDPARKAVRRLIARGALRLLERGEAGHLVEVRLPAEVPTVCKGSNPCRPLSRIHPNDCEELDFLKRRDLRRAIHLREGGRCFYCQSRLTLLTRCLDHVVPQVEVEDNSYRNVVSCCKKCNAQKKDLAAADFLRWLVHERRLTVAGVGARLRALNAPSLRANSGPFFLTSGLQETTLSLSLPCFSVSSVSSSLCDLCVRFFLGPHRR